jgi:hypothetical protein
MGDGQSTKFNAFFTVIVTLMAIITAGISYLVQQNGIEQVAVASHCQTCAFVY